MSIDILGTKYTIKHVNCGNVAHVYYEERAIEIPIGLGEHEERATIRHEIIHAFLFESGLGFNFEHNERGQEELMVDWIAMQYPKIKAAFEKAGAAEW